MRQQVIPLIFSYWVISEFASVICHQTLLQSSLVHIQISFYVIYRLRCVAYCSSSVGHNCVL